jgi:alpha-beta hydrolase superfamily lysophospholipase
MRLPILLALTLFTSACRISPSVTSLNDTEPSKFGLSLKHPGRGVAILAHGLNQRPSSLDPLADTLRDLGYHTARLTFTGHDREDSSVFQPIKWSEDLISSYRQIKQRFKNMPVVIVGYSLGGLVATYSLDRNPEFRPDKMVLIAPALSLRLLPQLGYLLDIFPPLSMAIPNLAPPRYRRFAYTPLFWYRNTLDLYSSTRTLNNSEALKRVPTTIIANPRDELISFCGLGEWIADSGLSGSWRLEKVEPDKVDRSIPQHVLIDQSSLGVKGWERLVEILGHL